MVRVKGIEPREYQLKILKTCIEKNTLVILPTGTGKTIIALLLAVNRLNKYPNSKVIFLAPTKPLANQHKETFLRHLEDIDKSRLIVVTGEIPPDVRKNRYKFAQIIFSTPQTLQNDLIQDRIKLSDVSLIIFDEAHRAVGKYPYVFIARKYVEQSKFPRILGLTASPGYAIERIRSIVKNLFIEAVEIRTGKERDISKYIKPIKIDWIIVKFNDKEREIDKLLKDSFDIRIEKLKDLGIISRKPKGKKEILEMVKEIRERLSEDPKNKELREALTIAAELVKIEHAIELFETQTYRAFVKYVEKILSEEGSKALRNVANDIRIRKAYVLTKNLIKEGKEHPKLLKLLELVEKYKDKKVLIFAQLKETVYQIGELLKNKGCKVGIFVGKSGMKREEQIRILNDFRDGKINFLVSTSVGEEGIDIPKVDVVIFYEPVPSEIRYIQRRGRTGRGEFGEVKILITKGTRDEAYMWASIKRERKMVENIRFLKKILSNYKDEGFVNLTKFVKEFKEHKIEKEEVKKKPEIVVIADFREKDSGVVQELVKNNVFVELRNLDIGDYIAGEYLIERKTVRDFVESIKDGRLEKQIEKLLSYEGKKLIIIEGESSPYIYANFPPNLIRSIIISLELKYGIPIIWTRNFVDTAHYIMLLARGNFENKVLNIKYNKAGDPRLQILTSIPGIGEKLAKKLLDRFGSIYKIITAPLPELEKIVGEKRARKIKEIFGTLRKEKKLEF